MRCFLKQSLEDCDCFLGSRLHGLTVSLCGDMVHCNTIVHPGEGIQWQNPDWQIVVYQRMLYHGVQTPVSEVLVGGARF